jgi:phosphatidylserine/phosphatidylglycerophosphate/cardiolipin synthase-like enzyme
LRAVLSERRAAAGRFADARDLLGIDGFDDAELAALVNRLSDGRRYGHRMRSVWGGPEGEREFFALLESATRYIHIETFIVGGETGVRLVELLARKVREGVKVRLLFCASGFIVSGTPSGTGFVSPLSELRSYLVNDMYVRRRLVRAMREQGVAFLNSSPIGRHWKRTELRRQGVRGPDGYQRWQRARGVPDAWLAEQEIIDQQCGLAFSNVDHRKMVIVDGERALIGSQNIADSYFYSNQLDPDPRVNVRRWQWHDSSTIIEGGCLAEMNRLFAQRWILSGGDVFEPDDSFYTPPPRQPGDGVVALEASIPGLLRMPWRRNLSRLLLSMLGADRRPLTEGSNPIRNRIMRLPELAHEEIFVEHCYPCDSELLEHWAHVASHVPSFTMIVPAHYDTVSLGLECDRFFPRLAASGIGLHVYSPSILHTKLAMVDRFYIATGSYNLTLRSGRADLEAQFFVQSAEYGRELHGRLASDLAVCKPARPNALARLRGSRSIPFIDAPIRYLLY